MEGRKILVSKENRIGYGAYGHTDYGRVVLVSFAQTPIYKTFLHMFESGENLDGSYINKGDEARVMKRYGGQGYELIPFKQAVKEFEAFKTNSQ